MEPEILKNFTKKPYFLDENATEKSYSIIDLFHFFSFLSLIKTRFGGLSYCLQTGFYFINGSTTRYIPTHGVLGAPSSRESHPAVFYRDTGLGKPVL